MGHHAAATCASSPCSPQAGKYDPLPAAPTTPAEPPLRSVWRATVNVLGGSAGPHSGFDIGQRARPGSNPNAVSASGFRQGRKAPVRQSAFEPQTSPRNKTPSGFNIGQRAGPGSNPNAGSASGFKQCRKAPVRESAFDPHTSSRITPHSRIEGRLSSRRPEPVCLFAWKRTGPYGAAGSGL